MGRTFLCVLGLLCLSFLLCCGNNPEPSSSLTVSPSWLSPGASVNLSCKVDPPSTGWRFYWYKAVPDRSQEDYRYELLADSINGTVEDSFIIHGQRHTAGYACRAGRGNQENLTDYSEPKFVWSEDSNPAASLTVSPDREEHSPFDEVQLICEGSSAEWRVRRFINYYGLSATNCSFWEKMTGSVCTLKYDWKWDPKAVYWCESASGEFSNAVNITRIRVSLTVSPSWLSPGASVNLSCKVYPPPTGWRFYWYKAVPDRSQKDYRPELLADSINGTVEDSFIIHGQRHTAGYTCKAGRGNQEILTRFSFLEFVWSADAHPAVSVSVSPDREQHFTDESVTGNCRGTFTHSRVWRAYKDGPIWLSHTCLDWETMNGSCIFNLKLEEPKKSSFQTKVFWCESGSGEFSSSVNITAVDGDVLLVSPVHPVTEGASVTLSCRRRGQNTLSNVFFYHNDKLVQNDSRGELKISAVSQSDEGFYKCEHSGKASPQSWMAVKAAGSSSFHVMWVIRPVIGIVLIILPLLVCRFRRSKGIRTAQTVIQDDHQQQVYSSLLHGDLGLYETIRGSGNSGNGQEQQDGTNVTAGSD
ncbi:uncharacterized protein LOC119779885 [Cyprinodon tularosa]|uniref:uncharacterized protein LOC119779885 n=1 Tax=Cyprinodon tularosa TaxID=77115 RepID=UPI0018E23C64|nr:uncharacterized protein LOC119779885 [Cyprinodon tularosa]